MKTLEEIKKHLLRFGYTSKDKYRICGWLVAKGIKDINETLIFREGTHTIENFIGWFECNEEEEKPFTCKKGDFVSVQRGIYGIALTDSKDGLVLLLDDHCVSHIYVITTDTRLSTNEEKERFLERIKRKGITYNDKDMAFGIDDEYIRIVRNISENNENEECVSFRKLLDYLYEY